MLGEIFGLKAGLTSVEDELCRFLLPRPPFCSALLGVVGLVGEANALVLGLCSPDRATTADGELRGPSFGVLRAATLGVTTSSGPRDVPPLTGGRESAASGRLRSSS
jgi:hypothetical protein